MAHQTRISVGVHAYSFSLSLYVISSPSNFFQHPNSYNLFSNFRPTAKRLYFVLKKSWMKKLNTINLREENQSKTITLLNWILQ